jgi:hypothetical protein
VHAPSEVKSADSKDIINEELEQPKHNMKILLVDFNLGRENVLKPSFGNERLHKDSNNNNDVRKVNFATSKNLFIKRAWCFLTETFINTPGNLLIGRLKNQIGHILMDRT